MDYVYLIRHLASPPAVHWGLACQEYWPAADVQPAHITISASQPIITDLTWKSGPKGCTEEPGFGPCARLRRWSQLPGGEMGDLLMTDLEIL